MAVLSFNDLPRINELNSNVAGLFDAISFLGRFKLDADGLKNLIGLIGSLGTADTTKKKVVVALDILVIVSAATPSETDDKIVAAAKVILSGKALDLLTNLVDAWLANRVVAQSTYEHEVTALAIDWNSFQEIAKLVTTIIRLIRENRKQ